MMIKQTCPECGSTDIVSTGKGSAMFMCKSCGYVGGTHDTPQLEHELGVVEDEFDDEPVEKTNLIKKSALKMPRSKTTTAKRKKK